MVWVVNTATDLLSSKVTLIVGRAACMFCGLGGRMRTGTIPNMVMDIVIYCSIKHPLPLPDVSTSTNV